MKRFKLGFGNKTVLEQINISRRVASGIGRLPAEHCQKLARHPVAASVAGVAAAVAEVESLKTTLRAALARRDKNMAAMREHTTSAAKLINMLTGSDPVALLRAGVEIKKPKQPVGKPGAPTGMRVIGAESEGVVSLRWKRPVRRCIFLIQRTTALSATRGWKQVAISIRQSCTVTGLKSGTKCWFRVSATNAHGQGPWSQPVSARVK